MNLLFHICCAPCLGAPLEALRQEGFQVSGFFFNPNIHPLLEFRKRVKALKVFLESDPLPVEMEESYGLDRFLEDVAPPRERRCARCYALRLERTARLAARQGAPAFSTTLLASRHQDHEAVKQAGEQAAERAGVEFLYRDFRPLADRSAAMARQKMLYRQAYCGCVFSEEERFRHTAKELYRGPGGGTQG